MQQRLAELISQALANPDDKAITAKAHSKFVHSTLILPTVSSSTESDFNDVVCQTIDGNRFIPIFSEPRMMKLWAKDLQSQFSFIFMKTNNLLPLLAENDYLVLDLGSPHYKEFSPDEVKYLMSICDKVLQESSEMAD